MELCISKVTNCPPIGCFALVPATQLKPDEGTPDLPEGRVRVRLETDGSLHDVTQYEIEKVGQLCSPLTLYRTLIERKGGRKEGWRKERKEGWRKEGRRER